MGNNIPKMVTARRSGFFVLLLLFSTAVFSDSSTVYYAIAVGKPGTGGSEIFDTTSRNYIIMSTIAAQQISKLKLPWKHTPAELERRLCIGLQQQQRDTAGFTDSLPYSAHEYCLAKGIAQVVVFHAYRTLRIKDTSAPTLGDMVTKMLDQRTSDEEILERTYILNASRFLPLKNRCAYKISAQSKEQREKDYTGSKDGEIGALVMLYTQLIEQHADKLEDQRPLR